MDTDFTKFIKRVKKRNFRAGSPYGLIYPSYFFSLGPMLHIYLPENHDDFIDFLRSNINVEMKMKEIVSVLSTFRSE